MNTVLSQTNITETQFANPWTVKWMFHSEIPAKWTVTRVTKYKRNLLFIKVAFLLVNLNPDFAIENSIFCSIKDQTNLRLQSERSTSERGSFRLVSQSGFRSLFHLMKLLFDRKNVLVHQ